MNLFYDIIFSMVASIEMILQTLILNFFLCRMKNENIVPNVKLVRFYCESEILYSISSNIVLNFSETHLLSFVNNIFQNDIKFGQKVI